MNFTRRTLTGLAAGAMLLAACGGDGGGATTTAASDTTSTTTAGVSTTVASAMTWPEDELDRSQPQEVHITGPPTDYTDENYPFTVAYPGGWTVQTELGFEHTVVAFYSPFLNYSGSTDESEESFVVSAWEAEVSLEEEAAEWREIAPQINGEGSTTVDGEPARWIWFAVNLGGQNDVQVIVVVTIFDQVLYQITYDSDGRDFAYFRDEWEAFLDSFTFHR